MFTDTSSEEREKGTSLKDDYTSAFRRFVLKPRMRCSKRYILRGLLGPLVATAWIVGGLQLIDVIADGPMRLVLLGLDVSLGFWLSGRFMSWWNTLPEQCGCEKCLKSMVRSVRATAVEDHDAAVESVHQVLVTLWTRANRKVWNRPPAHLDPEALFVLGYPANEYDKYRRLIHTGISSSRTVVEWLGALVHPLVPMQVSGAAAMVVQAAQDDSNPFGVSSPTIVVKGPFERTAAELITTYALSMPIDEAVKIGQAVWEPTTRR